MSEIVDFAGGECARFQLRSDADFFKKPEILKGIIGLLACCSGEDYHIVYTEERNGHFTKENMMSLTRYRMLEQSFRPNVLCVN